MPTPAEQLVGLTLPEGWKVITRTDRESLKTGGHFSCGYFVEREDGERAYLKALDYTKALKSPDPALLLQAMAEIFNHERELCMRCRETNLRRVVRIHTHGKIQIDADNAASVVQYLIFELASGDVRSQLDAADKFDHAWALRSLHHVATGLQELHGVGIAHQDLKPSNVLHFPHHVFKIADLGRATAKFRMSPHEGSEVAGDLSYAPPELLYHAVDPDWNKRRLGCDLYLLGSMIVFFFARTSMTGLLLSHMDPELHWEKWSGTYNEVQPYIRNAFGEAILSFRDELPDWLRPSLEPMVRQLCEPDPSLRGHPADRTGHHNPYSLERYVSGLNLLAEKAEWGLIGRG